MVVTQSRNKYRPYVATTATQPRNALKGYKTQRVSDTITNLQSNGDVVLTTAYIYTTVSDAVWDATAGSFTSAANAFTANATAVGDIMFITTSGYEQALTIATLTAPGSVTVTETPKGLTDGATYTVVVGGLTVRAAFKELVGLASYNVARAGTRRYDPQSYQDLYCKLLCLINATNLEIAAGTAVGTDTLTIVEEGY